MVVSLSVLAVPDLSFLAYTVVVAVLIMSPFGTENGFLIHFATVMESSK